MKKCFDISVHFDKINFITVHLINQRQNSKTYSLAQHNRCNVITLLLLGFVVYRPDTRSLVLSGTAGQETLCEDRIEHIDSWMKPVSRQQISSNF